MSFQRAFETGLRSRQDELDNERRARLDAQQAQLFQMQMAQMQREAAKRAEFDAAAEDYTRAFKSGGLDSAGAQAALSPYGLNRQQTHNITQAQLDEYNRPDSHDLQRTPEGYAYSADSYRKQNQPTLDAVKARGLLEPRVRMAIASGDTKALGGLQAEDVEIDTNELGAQHKTMRADPLFRQRIQAMVNKTNDRITVTKPDKPGGFWTATVVADSGESKNIKLSESQFDQFADALALAAKGRVPEAQRMIAAVNKDLADAVDKSNKTVDDIVKANNDGIYKQGMLDRADRQARAAERAAVAKGRGRGLQLVNEKTGQAGLFYEDQLKTDANGMLVLPSGWKFPKQRPELELLKIGEDGGQLAVNVATKKPLFKITPTGERLPAAADPWANSKVREQHGVQQIGRVLGEEDDGTLAYKYVDLANPDMLPVDTPDEVLRNRATLEREVAARRRGLGNVPSVRSDTRPQTPETQSPYFGLTPQQRLNSLR